MRLVLVVLSLLMGCVHTTTTPLGTATMNRMALNPSQVKLYRTAAQVPGKYEEVALLHSEGDSVWTNEPMMYESMRAKAAEVGANGIILDAISEPSAGAKVAGIFLGIRTERKGKSVAIYVYPPGEAPEN